MAITTLTEDRKKLKDAGVQFIEEPCFEGFWGTRIIFDNNKIARQAAKALDIRDYDIKNYFKKHAIHYF